MESIKKLKFEKNLRSGKFAVTCEIGPPKGAEVEGIREAAEYLKDVADGINVTDLQSSVMRLGSLTTCHLLKEWGLDPILQVTCRDRNRLALQSDLLNAYVMGIRNVLALTGDYTTIGDHPQAEPVFDIDSVQLLWVIKNLEEGKDLAGKELTKKPSFFKGAVVNPGADTEASYELQIIKMKKKIDQGAQFFQTLAGIILLKSEKMANYMNKFIPGVFVPELIVKKMEGTGDKVSMCIEIASRLIEEVKPYCAGVHIQALGWEKYIPAVVKNLK
jgi:5,10-methylenetetrahydrofolate reductase